MDMFSRLKGAIDSRIAEEQARQRQAALGTQQNRNTSRRRPQGQNGSTQRGPSRQREQAAPASAGAYTEKGPDPSEFEPEFAIGDEDSALPSRVATPRPDPGSTAVEAEKNAEKERTPDDKDGQDTGATTEAAAPRQSIDSNGSPVPSQRPQELPTDVRVKLRKLDRMEIKYAELLKAYRVAHSRIQVVETFEASLREHTPLTSINDPSALVEYVNQTNLKTDMVIEELKRVTTDRDDIKKKLQVSDEESDRLRAEVTELKARSVPVVQAESADLDKSVPVTSPSVAPSDSTTVRETEVETAIKSPASASSRIASFSLFSPRSKAVSPPPKESAEDLFSFDSEHARLESELQEKQSEVEGLKTQINNLEGDLKVARESTEGMVQSLENATRELHGLREEKDKFEQTRKELETEIDDLEIEVQTATDRTNQLEKDVADLTSERDEITQEAKKLQQRIQDIEEDNEKLRSDIELRSKECQNLNERLEQKDAIVSDLEDKLAAYKPAEIHAEQGQKESRSNEEKLAILHRFTKTLRGQLTKADVTIAELRADMKRTEDDFSSRPSTKVFGFLDESDIAMIDTLQSRDDVINYLSQKHGLQEVDPPTPAAESASPLLAAPEAASNSSKKKNKKKKKGKGKGQPTNSEEAEPGAPVKVSENLAETEGGSSDKDSDIPEVFSKLETVIKAVLDKQGKEMKEEVATKTSEIEQLTKQLKDQEALEEEIETLRDDLLHQGQGHVEARDALKVAQAERTTLQKSIDNLEKELIEARQATATGADNEKAHKQMVEQYEELQVQCSTLQKDLGAAEQLAVARFKDITDLKDLLAKAQPELRTLRNEVTELKSAKEDLKNKSGELNRLEARHEDLKAELKGLGKRLGDKDIEIKELQQKIEQETSTRTRIEKDYEKAQDALRNAQSQQQEALDVSEQVKIDLAKSRDEATTMKAGLRDLEDQLSAHIRQVSELKEEITMKTALHSSSQSLVQSLRDQMHELNMQARESTTRADSLEEELIEAQRMLSERTREGQTMRMLLDQSQSGTESRLREMKERLDAAIEERDRVEDEASVSSRRMMREVEEARSKARDAQKALKIVEDEKDELETRQRDWKRRRDQLEEVAARATKEVEDIRSAMTGLREALDESERQVRELDTQKAELRRTGEEARERVERLTKANKTLTEELKSAQAGVRNPRIRPGAGLDSGIPSSRTSIDSAGARSPAPRERVMSTTTSRSETPTNSTGLSQGTVDYVYLKNVLLQFLEQKDKAHQRQLIPVLGMLLHFDRKDEQKWMAAITAK